MMQVEGQHVLDLLLFPNHLEDDKANYVAIQDGYLFRRDDARLVAHRLPEVKNLKHFPLPSIENKQWDKVQLTQEGLVFVDEQQTTTCVQAVDVLYQGNSLQLLQWQTFDTVFRVEAKSIVKVLLIMQRKLLNQAISLHDVDVTLDWKLKTLSLCFQNEVFTYEIGMNVEKEGEHHTATYAYVFFKDFFIRANSFAKTLTFSVEPSYFTKIDYDDQTKAVLNHKRKRVLET